MLGKAFEKREKAGKEPGLEPEPELEGFGAEPSRSKGGGSGSAATEPRRSISHESARPIFLELYW